MDLKLGRCRPSSTLTDLTPLPLLNSKPHLKSRTLHKIPHLNRNKTFLPLLLDRPQLPFQNLVDPNSALIEVQDALSPDVRLPWR